MFVRYQSPTPGKRGVHTGVFGLINTLARASELTEAEHRDWREGNDWFNQSVINPCHVDPTVYDEGLHPRATAWFTADAPELFDHLQRHLEILEAHGVTCVRVESADPGRVIYQDDLQIVVDPHDADAVTSYHPAQ